MKAEPSDEKFCLSITIFDDGGPAADFHKRCNSFMADLAVLCHDHNLYYGGTSIFRPIKDSYDDAS